MAQRVFVGKIYQEWGFILGAIGFPVAVFGAIASLIVQVDETAQILLAVVAALLGSLLMWRYTVISANRRWITPNPTGFTLNDRRGDFDFPDESITDLATWVKVRYANGVPKANKRTGSFVVNMGELSTRFPLTYEFLLNAPDPLVDWVDRVFYGLVRRSADSIRQGGQIAGEGWVFDRVGLTLTTGKEDKLIPTENVTVVEVVEASVCIWVRGQAQAAAKIKAETPNALVMGRVLQDLVAVRPVIADDITDGLGRIIFERDKSLRGSSWFAGWLLLSVLLFISIILFVASATNVMEPWGYIAGPIGLIIVGLGAWAMFESRVNIFRCHALGVSHVKTRKSTELKYGDIGTMTYSATRMYHNGAYVGTQLKLVFDPLPGIESDSIKYSAQIKNADQELDNLREFTSSIVAQHMLKRLHAGKRVIWSPRVRFLPEGLEMKPVGWFKGNEEPRVVPYNQLGNSTFDKGVFMLSVVGENKWAVKETSTQANFFPGYALLWMILSPPAPQVPTDQDTNREENPNQDTE